MSGMTPILRLLDGVAWQPLPEPDVSEDGLPYATHSGTLELGGQSLRCYQLNDGQRVFEAADIAAFFGDIDASEEGAA